MSKHGTIRRYTLIIEKVGRKLYPSFDLIKDYLFEHGFEVSNRTVQRDIEQIRFEFGIEILYDRHRNGYYIDEANSVNMDSFLRFLEIVNTADLLAESLKESKDTLTHIHFESHGTMRGIENLKALLSAVKNYRKVKFSHENFETGKQKKYTVNPYMLKEYQNRWYLIGIVSGMDEFRTFGIDRILGLEVSSETFEPNSKTDPSTLFENTVGLTYSLNNLEDIILSFTPLQGKYVKSLPLHKSQDILEDNEHELRISLKIIPNYEFKQKILMLGENVKVIEPKWFADEVKESLKATLKKYD